MKPSFRVKEQIIPLLMGAQARLEEAVDLLEAMLVTADLTAYCNISLIGPNQRTVDAGLWLNESKAEAVGKLRPLAEGGSRSAMVARVKTGEIVVSDGSKGPICTPLISVDNRGSGWKGAVGEVEAAVGISAFAEIIDKLIATIGFYQLTKGGLYLADTLSAPEGGQTYCRWVIGGPGGAGLLSLLEDIFANDIVDIVDGVFSIENTKLDDHYSLFQIVCV